MCECLLQLCVLVFKKYTTFTSNKSSKGLKQNKISYKIQMKKTSLEKITNSLEHELVNFFQLHLYYWCRFLVPQQQTDNKQFSRGRHPQKRYAFQILCLLHLILHTHFIGETKICIRQMYFRYWTDNHVYLNKSNSYSVYIINLETIFIWSFGLLED